MRMPADAKARCEDEVSLSKRVGNYNDDTLFDFGYHFKVHYNHLERLQEF